MASHFQVKLSGEWKDYSGDEDKILKRAYLAGFPNARYKLRGQSYEIDFKNMLQKNVKSGKERNMRAPYKWKPPSAPIVPSGPTTCIKVPEGAAGTTIQVPHPKDKTSSISVDVPASAKTGQAMLVPVPPVEPSAPAAPADVVKEKSEGYSTGAKVAMAGGVVAAGGVAVAGAVLGAHIAEEGWDATMADLGDGLEAAGGAIADTAEEAGGAIAEVAEDGVDWAGDAADAAGDFIMDLF